MGGRGYSNNVIGYLNSNKRTVEFEAKYKSNDGKIDILVDKISPKAPTMPIFSNTENKIYAIVGKNGEIKSIGFYNDKHILTKTIHLDHMDKPINGAHVHEGDSYHHKSNLSRALNKKEWDITNRILKIWKEKRRK